MSKELSFWIWTIISVQRVYQVLICLRGFRSNRGRSIVKGEAKTRCQGQRSHSALDFWPVWASRQAKMEKVLAKASKKAWWNPTRLGGGFFINYYCCFLRMLVCFIVIYCHMIFFFRWLGGDASWFVQHRWRAWCCSMFATCTAIQKHLPEFQGDWRMGQNQDNMKKSLSATNYSGSGAWLCGWNGGADEPDQWGCREISFCYRCWKLHSTFGP